MNNNFYSLYCAGGSPELANKLDPSKSIDEYFELLKSKEYLDYVELYISTFANNIDGLILQSLHKLSLELSQMDPTEKNYPALLREKANLLKITSPLVERLMKISKEYDNALVFKNLTITIPEE